MTSTDMLQDIKQLNRGDKLRLKPDIFYSQYASTILIIRFH